MEPEEIETLADKLADFMEENWFQLDGDEQRAFSLVRWALQRVAEDKEGKSGNATQEPSDGE